MAIVFHCPHCGELHRVKDELAGRTGRCKRVDCRKQVLIPYQTLAPTNGASSPPSMDAEALAAAAFSEEPPPQTVQAPEEKISIDCKFCSHKFAVEAKLAGKNTRCVECGNILRVPLPQSDKPADWRKANEGKPSLARANEPVPAGAWDVQRKGVSGDAIRQAGAHEIEEEEEPGERRLRRLKQASYVLVVVGSVVFLVLYLVRSRGEMKQERWMEDALRDIEDAKQGPQRTVLQAAIHRFASEFYIRVAKNKEEKDAAVKHLEKSLSLVQSLPEKSLDRTLLLIEIGLATAHLGGSPKQVEDEQRASRDKIQKMARQALEKIPAEDRLLRQYAYLRLARTFTAIDQPMVALSVARNASGKEEATAAAARIGIAFILLGKKDLAEQVVARTAATADPEWTALWLGLHHDQDRPPATEPQPPYPAVRVGRATCLAYAEGRALQGRIADAIALSRSALNATDRLAAQLAVIEVAIATGKKEEILGLLDEIADGFMNQKKESGRKNLELYLTCDLCARAQKWDKVRSLLEFIEDPELRSWSRLQVIRARIEDQKKQRADDEWLDSLAEPPSATPVASCLARAACARQNAAIGESSYIRQVNAWPKWSIQPFGFAGIALGKQDRSLR